MVQLAVEMRQHLTSAMALRLYLRLVVTLQIQLAITKRTALTQLAM
jgi:hypothetical protein